MDMDQQQRNDIDNLQTDHISLSIDENNTLSSPLEIDLLDDVIISGNNWIITDDYLLKGNLADEDSLYFSLSQNLLIFKNVNKIRVQFSSECSSDGIVLESVGLSDGYTTNYEIVETVINNLSDVDVDCSLFGLESNDVNALMNDDYFTIVLGFNGKSLNSSLKLTDIKLVVYFDELLQDEIDTISNRLGWKSIELVEDVCTLYVNENLRLCMFYYHSTYKFENTLWTTLHTGLIPQEYRPLHLTSLTTHDAYTTSVISDSNGNMNIRYRTTPPVDAIQVRINGMWIF